jgi:hypothetical protein
MAAPEKLTPSEEMLPSPRSFANPHLPTGPIYSGITGPICSGITGILLSGISTNKVLGIFTAGKGSITGVLCDPKIIFQAALLANATSIILAHNHPSGSLKASQADLDMTKKIKAGAQLLEIELLDHLILTSEAYFSFADNGLL